MPKRCECMRTFVISGQYRVQESTGNVCVFFRTFFWIFYTMVFSLRGACDWEGSLQKLPAHIADKKCVQVRVLRFDKVLGLLFLLQILKENSDGLFVGHFGDFSPTAHLGSSVFGSSAMVHWKPVLLFSKKLYLLFIYLVVYRDRQGTWVLACRSYAGERLCERYRVGLF